MEWKDINVFQYQQIVKAREEQDEIERDSKMIAIINGWTLHQVDNLNIDEYNKQKKRLKFLYDEIDGKPVKYITVNSRRYKCIYDVRKINGARYIEGKTFSQDLVTNLHKIAASLVHPMKRTLFGWKLDKYDSAKHEDYSNDMLSANFVDVYHSVVFFYHVYRNWIEISKGYLMEQMKLRGATNPEKAVADLLNIMDGNIAPNLLPTTKISQLAKHMNYQ
jgi:hypothetical protein